MKTKDKVIDLLKQNRGEYLSGQQIADKLFVTRACVWKCIKALIEEGYEIDAITNKGYRLKVHGVGVNEEYIREQLNEINCDMEIFYKEEVVSTNVEALDFARENAKDGVFIADSQTGGRGRRGRSFFSPKGTGLYMSLLLHLGEEFNQIGKITAITACAVAKAIDDSLELEEEDKSKIKWVNDIFYKDKKVCGILCEFHSSLEDLQSQCVVIGIGINVFWPEQGFPKDISKTAGSLVRGDNQEFADIKNKLVIEIIKNLMHYYKDGDATKECLNIYREKSFLLGSYIKINPFDGNSRYAKAVEINEDYHLIVEYDNGQKEELSSGEVSTVKY